MDKKVKAYYLLPTDSFGQPSGIVKEVQLTEGEFMERRKREWIFEEKYEAEWRAQA